MPEKTELSQIIIKPPEAPSEGIYTKSSNLLGQHNLIKAISKWNFFVSCKQTTEHPLILIAFISANCLECAFQPLIFEQSTIHFFKRVITKYY
jgi:hypothetical protein